MRPRATAVRTGNQHSVVLFEDGSVWTCGANDDFQCGHSQGVQRVPKLTPIDFKAFVAEKQGDDVNGGVKIKHIGAFQAATVCVDTKNRVWMFTSAFICFFFRL